MLTDMGQFLEIISIVLPVFLVVGLGYGVKRSAIVDRDFLFQLNRLIYYLALPSLLFYKIATADKWVPVCVDCGLKFVCSFGF